MFLLVQVGDPVILTILAEPSSVHASSYSKRGKQTKKPTNFTTLCLNFFLRKLLLKKVPRHFGGCG